ncbi:MAG: diguanylate cyclase [Candidatus Magnetominusculus sp. LBB02]|nr:diguanylate cyclase [Candidatus Magnetominusculus sp. LBB02]
MERKRIMIVEDEAITGAYLESTLRRLGYVVTSVESSSEKVLERAALDMPDLILMDIHINGKMDGIDTANQIRTHHNIPVVYLTAHSDEATLDRAKLTEPFGYVLKPVEPAELKTSIEIALYKHQTETKLKELAHYDQLTGLPNRTLFFDRLDQALKHAKRNNKDVALMMIDLDGFKCINDRMGHDAGDSVLVEIAKRLSRQVRDSDTVARFGGDEFVIILSNLSGHGDAETLALKIIIAVGRPFQFETPYCAIGASIGISFYPTDGHEADALLKKADSAMYLAKENGKNNYQLFNNIHNKVNGDIRAVLQSALKFVLEHKEGWDHSQWLEFLIDLKEHGFFISRTIEPYVGAILEALKKLHSLPPSHAISIEEFLSHMCDEAAGFIMANNGMWTIHDWEAFLAKLEAAAIVMDKETTLSFLDLIEATKSLYVLCC